MIWLAICLAPAFVLALAVIWRREWYWAAIYAALMGASLFGAVELQGQSKPIWAEWRETKEMQVIAVHYEPDQAIFVWVLLDQPRALRLPWSDKTARESQEMAARGLPYVMDYEEQQGPTFYPMPQLPMPEKSSSTEESRVWDRSQTSD